MISGEHISERKYTITTGVSSMPQRMHYLHIITKTSSLVDIFFQSKNIKMTEKILIHLPLTSSIHICVKQEAMRGEREREREML